jgi:hypothetical protein
MIFDDIFRVSRQSRVASEDDVLTLEALIGSRMPPGYSEFVMQFGEGTLTDWLDVYCPWRIQAENRRWQERVCEYFFWEEGREVLARTKVEQSICLGHTSQGDELIFHPNDSRRLLVLPRNEEGIYIAGHDLEVAVDWIFNSGKLGRRVRLKAFQPFADRARTHFECLPQYTPPDKLKQSLLGLGLHDEFVEEEEDEHADQFLEMFVQEFGGYLVMLSRLDYAPQGPYSVTICNPETKESFVDGIPMQQIPRRPELWIDHEQGVEGAKFEAIVECLQKNGLVRGRTIPGGRG